LKLAVKRRWRNNEKKYEGLILGPLPPPSGGIATFCEDLLENMSKSKFRLIHFKKKPFNKSDHILVKFVSIFVIYTRFLILLFKTRPYFVHINTASYRSFFWNSIFLILSKLFLRSTILHIHGGGFASFYKESNHVRKFLIRKILHITDNIIALSSSWKKVLSLLVSEHKISVIPNGVNVMSFNTIKASRNEFHFSSNSLVVSFMGSLTEDKGIYDILKAIPLVTRQKENCVFAFAGRADDTVCNSFKLKDIKEHIFFLGELFGDKKIRFLLSSDIFLLPSYVEGLPIVLLEAMAAGLPVVSTPVGAIPELVKEDCNGYLIAPGDYNALATKILTLAEDENLRKKMGLNNSKKMANQYDFRIISAKIERLYEQLMIS